jgi:hypothetical protein
MEFGVTNFGKGEIFLGHDCLKIHNPSIDWRKGLVEFDRCPSDCQPHLHARCTDFDFDDDEEEDPPPPYSEHEDGDQYLLIDPTPAIQIRASTNKAMELAIKANDKKEKKHWKETMPEYLHDFSDVFEEKDFKELPPHRFWDHTIELLPGSEH